MKKSTAKSIDFHPINRKKVVADFLGGTITSDAGGLLLRELEQASGIIKQFSECFTDHRNAAQAEEKARMRCALGAMTSAPEFEPPPGGSHHRRPPGCEKRRLMSGSPHLCLPGGGGSDSGLGFSTAVNRPPPGAA